MSNFRRRLSTRHPKVEYLRFTALAPSTVTRTGTYASTLEYSKDEVTWTPFDSTVTVELAEGEWASFRGVNSTLASSTTVFTQFVMTGSIEASGNIMSLLYSFNCATKKKIENRYCFLGLFLNCTSLVTPPELPATTLALQCYYQMFKGCTSLTVAPELPSVNLGNQCYQDMFNGCTALVSAPELPATVGTTGCYQGMFYGCTSLVNVYDLPITVGVLNCYSNMFRGCTSLVNPPKIMLRTVADNSCNSMFYGDNKMTEAPALLSETLILRCYSQMFRNCSRLSYIKMLAIDGTDSDWGSNWLLAVPNNSSCIFVKHINATWTNSGASSGVPTNWTIIYYNPTTDKYYLSDKTTECDDHGNVV